MALVCWSGGLDSTTALYLLACRYRDATEDNPAPDSIGLRAISVVCDRVPCQVQQGRAREKLKRWFKKQKLSFQHTTATLTTVGDFDLEGGGLSQPVIWLGAAMSYLHEEEDLTLGYVKGDDLWHHVADIRQAFAGLAGLKNKYGKLDFPLEWEPKAKVIRGAKLAGFYDLCWWCEACSITHGHEWTKRKPCGICPACRTHRTAEWQLKKKLWPEPPIRCQADVLKKVPA